MRRAASPPNPPQRGGGRRIVCQAVLIYSWVHNRDESTAGVSSLHEARASDGVEYEYSQPTCARMGQLADRVGW